MGTEYADIDRADEQFCRDLVKKVPELEPVFREHLLDQGGAVLGYIFLSEVARWAEANPATREGTIVSLLGELNRGLAEGDQEVPNLIAVGFCESLSSDTSLRRLLHGDLKAWHEFDLGISTQRPELRSGA